MCQNDDGAWDLVGVVSWGDGECRVDARPTVYSRVSWFTDFFLTTKNGQSEFMQRSMYTLSNKKGIKQVFELRFEQLLCCV